MDDLARVSATAIDLDCIYEELIIEPGAALASGDDELIAFELELTDPWFVDDAIDDGVRFAPPPPRRLMVALTAALTLALWVGVTAAI
jgi:hypothetical protein